MTAGAGLKVAINDVSADGKAGHWEFTAVFDGKDKPVTGTLDFDTAAATRIDANTVKIVFKERGNVSVTTTAVVSKDGKTITTTDTSTNAQGQVVTILSVYEKQ
ncbi:MAG: hypothetical protein WCP29_08490 [Acidobacteriota bacterium]